MNFFINQGRCRVCGQIFCCTNHQKEHENVHHKEYAYILNKLPIICKQCHRCIYFVFDLHLNCHPYMNPNLMNGTFSDNVSTAKSSRKRPLKENDDLTLIQRSPLTNEQRKKLVPVYKFDRVDIHKFIANTDASQMLLIGFNHVVIENSVFSPQLNISYATLADSVVKSSTPLNEEDKQDLPRSDQTIYATPPSVPNSIVIISAKKNTPPGIISKSPKRLSKKVAKNRKVTFEVGNTSEIEDVSVYSTPPSTMQVRRIDEFDIKMQSSPQVCLLSKMIRRMRTAIYRIPRTISSAWGWSDQRLKTSTINERNEDVCSPVKKRIKYDTDDFLSRRPITSYWVNMSVNSLFRKPLPNYVERYYSFENISQ